MACGVLSAQLDFVRPAAAPEVARPSLVVAAVMVIATEAEIDSDSAELPDSVDFDFGFCALRFLTVAAAAAVAAL